MSRNVVRFNGLGKNLNGRQLPICAWSQQPEIKLEHTYPGEDMRLKTEMGAATNCPLFSSAFDLTVAASAAVVGRPKAMAGIEVAV